MAIVEFLLARLEEDETDAKQLITNFPSLTAAMHGPRQAVDSPKLEIGAARVQSSALAGYVARPQSAHGRARMWMTAPVPWG